MFWLFVLLSTFPFPSVWNSTYSHFRENDILPNIQRMLLPGKETWPLFLVLLVHPLLTTNQLLCSGPGDVLCKSVYQHNFSLRDEKPNNNVYTVDLRKSGEHWKDKSLLDSTFFTRRKGNGWLDLHTVQARDEGVWICRCCHYWSLEILKTGKSSKSAGWTSRPVPPGCPRSSSR